MSDQKEVRMATSLLRYLMSLLKVAYGRPSPRAEPVLGSLLTVFTLPRLELSTVRPSLPLYPSSRRADCDQTFKLQ